MGARWRWINDAALVLDSDQGIAVVVGTSMRTTDPETGVLVPFDRFSPDAALIASAPSLKGERDELLSALRAAVDDLGDTYVALKKGMPVVSVGQWGRLQRMKELLARTSKSAAATDVEREGRDA